MSSILLVFLQTHCHDFMKYGSGKCVSSTFPAPPRRGSGCLSEFQTLAASADRKKMSPVMLLLADPAQSCRYECSVGIYNDPALFGL